MHFFRVEIIITNRSPGVFQGEKFRGPVFSIAVTDKSVFNALNGIKCLHDKRDKFLVLHEMQNPHGSPIVNARIVGTEYRDGVS